MNKADFIVALRIAEEFFSRTISCFDEGDSGFSPQPDMMTVARQVAHVAQTIDWFIAGAFESEGFDLDFSKHEQELQRISSLAEAKELLKRAVSHAVGVIEGLSEEKLEGPLPEGPIMGGAPRFAVSGAISDHTAHHRGSLAVYARLVGKRPPMPYA